MDKYGGALCISDQKKLHEGLEKATADAKVLFFALLDREVPAKIEKFDGFKHIDIAVPSARVNIEVDGGHHNFNAEQALRDIQRTVYSLKKGFLTLRIPNSLVRTNLEQTADYIVDFVNESSAQLHE